MFNDTPARKTDRLLGVRFTTELHLARRLEIRHTDRQIRWTASVTTTQRCCQCHCAGRLRNVVCLTDIDSSDLVYGRWKYYILKRDTWH